MAREMQRPTVAHEIRIYSEMADLFNVLESQAIERSKSLVNLLSGKAHGTAAVTTP